MSDTTLNLTIMSWDTRYVDCCHYEGWVDLQHVCRSGRWHWLQWASRELFVFDSLDYWFASGLYCLFLIFFSFLFGVEWNKVYFTEATTGLLYQTRMMMCVEQSVEYLAGETEILRENLRQCRFVHPKSHMIWPGLKPMPPADWARAQCYF
jgi:hypothetical protein